MEPNTPAGSTARIYSRPVLEAAADRLPTGDWDAHRQLARMAVASGYSAQVTQDFSNSDHDANPLTHRIAIGIPPDFDDAPEITPLDEQEGPMGSTRAVETFRADLPDGHYGAITPLDDSPAATRDWPHGPSGPSDPSQAHLTVLESIPGNSSSILRGPNPV